MESTPLFDTGTEQLNSRSLKGRSVGITWDVFSADLHDGTMILNINISRSTDDFLGRNFTVHDEYTNLFHQVYAKEAREYDNWLSLMEQFPRWLASRLHTRLGYPDSGIVNTYNHDCLLDYALQYRQFSLNGVHYVLLQVHNGGDVRGGYSAPIVYQVNAEDMYTYNECAILCEQCDAVWVARDAGLTFDPVQTYNNGKEVETYYNLGHYKVVWFDDLSDHEKEIGNSTLNVNGTLTDLVESRYNGSIILREDKVIEEVVVHCPHCGGILYPSV